MEIFKLIFAGGLGGVIAAIIQSFWASKTAKEQKIYQEKKDAYVGLLKAIHRSEREQTHDAALYLGHWFNICELVGSQLVIDGLERHMLSNPVDGKVHPNRPKVMKDLKQAMRKDLGISL